MAGDTRLQQDRSPVVFAVTLATIACATIFVFFRLVSRIGVVKKYCLFSCYVLVILTDHIQGVLG